MQIDKKQFTHLLALTGLAVVVTYGIIINLNVILGTFTKLLHALTPFFIGFSIAYILNPLVNIVSKTFKLKRGLSILVVFAGILFLLSLFVNLVVPSIIGGSIQIAQDIPNQVKQFSSELKQFNIDNPQINDYVRNVILSIQGRLTDWANIIITNVTGFFLNFTSAVMSFIFGTIVSIYGLLDKEKFKKLSKKVIIAFMGDEKAMKFLDFMTTVNNVFSSFISGLIVDALIVGVLAFIGLSLLGIEYALIFAIIICFTNVIPYIGPFLGAIPAVGITLLYDPIKALYVMIFIVILQQIDANVIGPRVMGNYIGLDAIWIILAIAIGGAFAGMLGMILSIPVAAIIKILVSGALTDKFQKQHSKIKL